MFISHSKAFQGKPVIRDFSLTIKREASRQKWENGCHKDPPLRWRCLSPLCSLPSPFFSGWCRMQKRLARRRQQQADDAHPSLIKLRGFGLSAGHFTHSHYAELFSETENCENTKRIAISSKPQVFSRKCAPASSLSSASCSWGVTSTPFSHCTAPW